MTVLRSGGRITVMRLLRTKLKILIPVLLVITAISAAVFARQQKKILVIEELETGNVYRVMPKRAFVISKMRCRCSRGFTFLKKSVILFFKS